MTHNVSSLVANSLEYFDNNSEKYDKIIKNVNSHELILNNLDMQKNQIILYDNKGEQIYKSDYEIIGLYDNSYKLWSWAWAVPYLEKNSSYISRKILMYGLDIIFEQSRFLKSELITSRFKITDPVQLNIHVAIASYLAKKPFIYKYKYYPKTNKSTVVHDSTDTHGNIEPELSIYSDISDDEQSYVIYYLFLLDEKINQ